MSHAYDPDQRHRTRTHHSSKRHSRANGWTCRKCGTWHPSYHPECWKCQPRARPPYYSGHNEQERLEA